jgi:CCR4-NOT transcription complex subunit 1
MKSSLRKSSVEYNIDLNIKPIKPVPLKKPKISQKSLELQKEFSQFKSIHLFIQSRFHKLESKLHVSTDQKNQIRDWFQRLINPIESHVPKFREIVNEKELEEWWALYMIYIKALGETSYHKLYISFLGLVDRKPLSKRIYYLTMEVVDQIMMFGRYVNIQSSEDNQYLRNVAKWLGAVTICRNKPILKFKLDIRQRVLEALKTPTINAFVTILTILISIACDSMLYRPQNPFIQSLLDLCRELNMVSSVTPASKNYILLAFKKVQMKDKDCYSFGFIDKHSDLLSLRNQKNNHYPETIILDRNALIQMSDKEITDIKNIVMKAIISSVKTVTKPVLERSVKNAILTTRLLCKKDLAQEPDANKFEKAAQAMVTNLAGNLALVTCKEPLRSQITQKLHNLLTEYAEGNERLYEKIRRSIPEKNLNLACEMVYRRVILNAMEQIGSDEKIRTCLTERSNYKNSGRVYIDTEEMEKLGNLPKLARQTLQQTSPYLGEIYLESSKKIGISNYVEISRGDGLLISSMRSGHDHFESPNANEDTLKRTFQSIEREMNAPNSNGKYERINRLFFRMQKILKDFKGDLPKATENMTILIFQRIMHLGIEMDRCRAFFDLIGLFHKFNKNISSIIAEILANIKEKKKNKLMLASYLFRKNLINLKKFDKAFAMRLRENILEHVNVTVQILKRLVIEEKIFDIQSFPEITEELLKIDISQSNKALKSGSKIFIKNMSDYLREQTASSRTKFSLSNLETEYSKLRIDLDEYFTNQKEKEMSQMRSTYLKWMQSTDNPMRQAFVVDFVNNFMKAETKNNLILIFSYLFEHIVSKTLESERELSYRLIDSFSLMVVMILERLEGTPHKIHFLERVLSSLIMVITRHHFFYEEGRRFNQKPFFRILFNLVLEINRRKNFNEEERMNVSIIMIHTLRILQPVKYPGFSFTWLALVSNKFIMRSLLLKKKNENWQNYTMLLNGLMLFFKEAQTQSPSINMTPQVNKFYKATLFFLLVLAHDFPEYVSDQSEFILEEVPESFTQIRNIILSATPASVKMPPPRKAGANLSKIEEECQRLPNLPYKIENRVCSMNLNVRLANFFQRMDSKEIENIRDLLYLFDYSGKSTVNKKLVKSFTLYTAYFVYSKCFPGTSRNVKKMRSLRKETYKLFLTLLMKDEDSLRVVLINSFVDNLRFCDFYTVYFIQLLGFIVTDSENLVLEELVFKILFERFLVGDLHPWGLTTAIFYLFNVSNEFISQKKYYKENKELFSTVLGLIAPNSHKTKNP